MRFVDLARVRPASNGTARKINRDILLELIRESQPVSRAELSRRSGLQRSTVSQIVEQLLREGWIREGPAASLPRGRRPTMLGLNQDLGVLAADIHPESATVAFVDLNGRILSRSKVRVTANPETSTERINDAFCSVKSALSRHSIQGVGVSLPGRVDPVAQRLVFAPNLRWHDFDLHGTISKKMNLPVRMDNSANVTLLSELVFGHVGGIRNMVLVSITEGIGTGLLVNGQLVTGKGGLAGEFGHAPLDPDGPQCTCGRRGCWEVWASCRAATRYFRELKPDTPPMTFLELVHLSDRGDPNASLALEMQAQQIGRGLGLFLAGLSPAIILIAGDVTSAWSRIRPIIENQAKRFTVAGDPPHIMAAHGGEDARLRGAAALVLQRRWPSRQPDLEEAK